MLSSDRSPRRRLLVFLKEPKPGRVKTRLVPELGEAGAARLYRAMICSTLSTCRPLREEGIGITLLVDPPGAVARMAQTIARGLDIAPQARGDLGRRLKEAFQRAFESGATSVAVIGTDSPALSRQHVQDAFRALEETPAVVGPSFDGGYYLFGLREFRTAPFENVPWSSSETCEATLAALRGAGLAFSLLPPLPDVDRPGDLARLESEEPPPGSESSWAALLADIRSSGA